MPRISDQPKIWTRMKLLANAGRISRKKPTTQTATGTRRSRSARRRVATSIGALGSARRERAVAMAQRTLTRPCGRKASTRTMIKKVSTTA